MLCNTNLCIIRIAVALLSEEVTEYSSLWVLIRNWIIIHRAPLSYFPLIIRKSFLALTTLDCRLCTVPAVKRYSCSLLSSLSSDHTVWPPLFRDGIGNATNMFRPEPNLTRHRIFTFVSLLFTNLKLKLTNKMHTDFGNGNMSSEFWMLTFVWPNRQPMSDSTYLFARYLLICHYTIGCVSVC